MNSYERVFNRLNGMAIDRIPNFCIVMMFAAKQRGIPYGKYVTDYRLLCDGVWNCYENFGVDCLCVISDPMREAEGFGTDVVFPEDGVPYARTLLIDNITNISRLKIVEPSLSRRMADRLEAVRLLKEKSAGQVPVIGWVEGAFAESCDLIGLSEMMTALYDNPEGANELLFICEQQAELFALEQIEAGADIIGIGEAAASLIGPELYRQFALPFEQKLISAIHKATTKVKLHICGNINSLLPLISLTGADIVDCDHMVDIDKAVGILPKQTSVCGNFDPVSILLQGNRQIVRKAVERCCGANSSNHIISAGCEVPKLTPSENLYEVSETLRDKGSAVL